MTANPSLTRQQFLKISAAFSAALLFQACRRKLVFTPTPPPSPTPEASVTPEEPARHPATLPGTDTWTLTAQSNGQEYRIFVNFPANYGDGENAYPVIYLTDGNGNFPLLRSIYGQLNREKRMPQAIIIGIGYPTDDGQAISALRGRDFTPTYFSDYQNPSNNFPSGTGGAASFFEFIWNELKPAVDARYRTLPNDNTLIGHSLGGLFGLYVLFQPEGSFNRYLIASPSIWWDNNTILGSEEAYAAGHTDLPVRVFMSAGTDEPEISTAMQDLAKAIQERAYPHLTLTTQVFPDEGHLTVVPFALSRGLRTLFTP